MKKSSVTTLVVGAAAFLAVGAAAASAQAKPKTPAKPASSTTRIPVTKETPGEVVSRVDTVTVTRIDTIRVPGPMRVDTVTTTNTVTRYDTTRIETLPAYLISRGGLYFGLGGGIDFPRAAIRTVNQPGATMQAQVGWQPLKSALGLRADAAYTVYGEDAAYADLGGRPDVISLSGDAKLQLPFLSSLFGQIPRFNVYALAGATYSHFKNLRNQMEPGNPGGIGPRNVTLETGSGFGWNAGGGVSWHWGATELFVESRMKSYTANKNSDAAHQLPFVLGFNWY